MGSFVDLFREGYYMSQGFETPRDQGLFVIEVSPCIANVEQS